MIPNMITLVLALVLQDGDLEARIGSARKAADWDNLRVLVVWGADDACRETLAKNRLVSGKIKSDYVLVHADPGQAEIAKKLGADVSKLPWMTILGGDGKPVANLEAPAEPKALVDLLKKHQPEPLKAKAVLEAAIGRAKAEKKRLLLTFGAPW